MLAVTVPSLTGYIPPDEGLLEEIAHEHSTLLDEVPAKKPGFFQKLKMLFTKQKTEPEVLQTFQEFTELEAYDETNLATDFDVTDESIEGAVVQFDEGLTVMGAPEGATETELYSSIAGNIENAVVEYGNELGEVESELIAGEVLSESEIYQSIAENIEEAVIKHEPELTETEIPELVEENMQVEAKVHEAEKVEKSEVPELIEENVQVEAKVHEPEKVEEAVVRYDEELKATEIPEIPIEKTSKLNRKCTN